MVSTKSVVKRSQRKDAYNYSDYIYIVFINSLIAGPLVCGLARSEEEAKERTAYHKKNPIKSQDDVYWDKIERPYWIRILKDNDLKTGSEDGVNRIFWLVVEKGKRVKPIEIYLTKDEADVIATDGDRQILVVRNWDVWFNTFSHISKS